MERNNMFKYATKELSQDAFICWCINWINYKYEVKGDKNQEKLYEMSKKILDKILENTSINSSYIDKVNIIRQFENIDIILVITTKALEEYVVIIEDKVGGNLSEHQRNDLYVSKLIKALKNNKEKQYILSLNEFKEENIIPVFWKTREWNEKKEDLQKELNKNTGRKAVCINGNDTLEILKKYTQYSEIVKDFYTCLQDYLRINNQLPEDEHCVSKIVENLEIIEGTVFSKNYLAYNCFSKLIGREYDSKRHPQIGGIVLNKLSKRIIKENILNKSNELKNKDNKGNIVAVDTIRFFTFKSSYKNYLKNDNKLWIEELEQKAIDKEGLYTNLRYIFLFARRLNAFRNEQYEFLGLYKLIRYDEKNKTRFWEKQEINKGKVPLNEDEIIKVIKKLENK